MGNQSSENRQEEKDNVVDLKLVTGGKGPPTTGETWLDKLPIGSCFLVKDRNNSFDFVLGLFRIGTKTERSVVLNSPSQPGNLYIDPVAFCNKYRMYEDLGLVVTPDEEAMEDTIERDRLQPPDGGPTDQVE